MGRDLGGDSTVESLFRQPLRNILTAVRKRLDLGAAIAREFPFAPMAREGDRIAQACAARASSERYTAVAKA